MGTHRAGEPAFEMTRKQEKDLEREIKERREYANKMKNMHTFNKDN
jgi:hypothetical protein